MARGYKGRDRYGQRAHDEGFAARSVYKLQEIDRRTRILRSGQRVVDLGCFPGSWSRYALERIGGRGSLVGVDLEAPSLSGGQFLARSVFEVTADELRELLGGPADVLLSDMAQHTSGHKDADHYQQLELARQALALADALVVPGGAFVCKVFEGPEAKDLEVEARAVFGKVKRYRPDAVRRQSREWFLVGTGRRS